MPDQTPIVISRNAAGQVVFPTTGLTLTQMAFFRNTDPQAPHWPVFSGPGAPVLPNQVGIGQTSIPVEPGQGITAGGGKPPIQGQVVPVSYTCKLHPGESGVVNVVADFLVPSIQVTFSASAPQPFTPIPLTTGGMAPYPFNVTDSDLPENVSVVDGGISGPSLNYTGGQVPGTATFRLNVSDAFGNAINTVFILTITK